MKRKNLVHAVMAASAVLPVTEAISQEGGRSAASLEEVIVTARKREESLQDVPLAITALSAQAIVTQDMRNLEDFANNTVGMTYLGGSTSGYQAAPTIRGLSSGYLQNRVQNVAVFMNGIYLQRQSMMNMGLVDMERIEVVRGPQNSLYGHSAFAGAINYVTKGPSTEFEAYVGTVQGTDERADYTGAISGPIIGETLLGRAAFGVSEFDGPDRNYHPFADADPSGFNNEGNLGGWDDESYNLSLAWLPSDSLEFGASYYSAELQRENTPHYVIGGLREVAAIQTSRYDDMNFNQQTMLDGPSRATYTGNTMWRGELPFSPGPGTCINEIPFAYPCPAEDQRSDKSVVDPRGYGFIAETDIWAFTMDWDIGDDMALNYAYGNASHESSTGGPAERDPLNGATMLDVNIAAKPFPTLAEINMNISSARPLTELDMQSHELRLDWQASEKLDVTVGAYYAETEDAQYDLTIFAPVCSDRDRNGNGSTADEAAACDVSYTGSIGNSPLDDFQYNPFALFSAQYWNGAPGNKTEFEDQTAAIFAAVDWRFAERWNLRLEGRYANEKKEISRQTDGFGLEYGQTGCINTPLFPFPFCFNSTIKNPSDDETFNYLAPRATLEWAPGDYQMVYATVAKGIKTGGFNNAELESQQTYDEEENITFELGSKNIFADGRLRLNGSLYYIDWTDMQGSQPPLGSGGNILNGSSVIGNIGDVESYGLELEGTWQMVDALSLDFGASFNNAEFQDGTDYDAAQRYYYYQCDQPVVTNGDYCGETGVGGNKVPRNSEQQYMLALNYMHEFTNGWSLDARLDANYQSKQYITPLNSAYIPSRTLSNLSVQLRAAEHWDFSLWVKNLTDEEYVGGVILVAEQNKLLVGQGAGRSAGLGLRYLF
jgi:iron complex outermembrane recepter protein